MQVCSRTHGRAARPQWWLSARRSFGSHRSPAGPARSGAPSSWAPPARAARRRSGGACAARPAPPTALDAAAGARRPLSTGCGWGRSPWPAPRPARGVRHLTPSSSDRTPAAIFPASPPGRSLQQNAASCRPWWARLCGLSPPRLRKRARRSIPAIGTPSELFIAARLSRAHSLTLLRLWQPAGLLAAPSQPQSVPSVATSPETAGKKVGPNEGRHSHQPRRHQLPSCRPASEGRLLAGVRLSSPWRSSRCGLAITRRFIGQFQARFRTQRRPP